MQRLLVLAVAVVLAPAAVAKVWVTVYRCDERTPLALADPNQPDVYRDIMVGTRLVMVVSSDTGGYWVGSLRLPWDDYEYGALAGRDARYNEPRPYYQGSALESAGTSARVKDYQRETAVGFELRSDYKAVPGDWFILDYHALQVGPVDVHLYDLIADFNVPTAILSLNQVPSRDFDSDGIVNFEDLALLAWHWRSAADPDPNSTNAAFDLNADGLIDVTDLTLFSEYWLERTDCNEPAAEPNSPVAGL